jgi:hypothetical protein
LQERRVVAVQGRPGERLQVLAALALHGGQQALRGAYLLGVGDVEPGVPGGLVGRRRGGGAGQRGVTGAGDEDRRAGGQHDGGQESGRTEAVQECSGA